MNRINVEERAAKIAERIKRGNTAGVQSSQIFQSTLSKQDREKKRAEITAREKGYTNESNVQYTIARSVLKKDSNIISSSRVSAINATERAAQIRKQKEIDYAKGRR